MRCTIWLRLGLGLLQFRLRSGLGQKFANCACTISKLHSAFYKLCRLKNHAQQIHDKHQVSLTCFERWCYRFDWLNWLTEAFADKDLTGDHISLASDESQIAIMTN